jgi:DNA-binding transcriptional LysR family regulator
MNLDQLEAICAVVDTGSFRSAAQKLHRSQPALSASIKNLEQEFDLLIFDRSEYRPKLTPAGAAFLSVSRLALESAQYASRVAKELGNQAAETQLCVSIDALISLEIVELLTEECSRPLIPVNLVIEKTILKGSYEPLLSGKLQLAFAACSGNIPKLEKIPLEKVTLIGAISRRLLQEKRKPSESFLRKNPQIITYDKQFDEEPDEMLGGARADSVGHKIFAPDHFTKLRLIEGGLGWGRISTAEFKQIPDLVQIDSDLCEHVHLELCLLRAKHLPIGPVARRIWSVFEARAKSKRSN